jgi:thiamine-phosphate pyrophosphorylase
LRTAHLYLLADPALAPSFPDVLHQALAGGVDIIQFRAKDASPADLQSMGHLLVTGCRASGALSIINDHISLAVDTDADGVHLGLSDSSIAEARAALGDDRLIGATTHSLEEARVAWEAGADYVSVGPMYGTPLKPDLEAEGFAYVEALVRECPVPIVAIGGIDLAAVSAVAATGVRCVAVCRDVLQAEDPKQRAEELRAVISSAVQSPGSEQTGSSAGQRSRSG